MNKNTHKITIIKASFKDVARLQAIGKKTFVETFSEVNTVDNMERYLNEGFSKEKLLSEMNTDGSVFYFAQHQNQIVGYLKINTGHAQTELQHEHTLEIERIYVLQEFQGLKIGQLLLEKAIEIAHQMKAQSIWLGIWEENHRAIRFYEKNGFVAFDKHIFRLGDDEQTDIMMKKNVGTN